MGNREQGTGNGEWGMGNSYQLSILNLRKAPLLKGGWGDLRVGNTYFLVTVATIPVTLTSSNPQCPMPNPQSPNSKKSFLLKPFVNLELIELQIVLHFDGFVDKR